MSSASVFPTPVKTISLGGTDATPTATKSSTGVYYVDLTLAEAGVHTVRFQGIEGVIATEILDLEVAHSVFD